jgi:hypothetical protein
VSSGVEDGESGCKHGKNDKTTSKIDSSQEYLCDAYPYFDFLLTVSVMSSSLVLLSTTYQVLCLLLLGRFFLLLEHLLFPEGRAKNHGLSTRRPWWSAW